jgi:hypothetical protein
VVVVGHVVSKVTSATVEFADRGIRVNARIEDAVRVATYLDTISRRYSADTPRTTMEHSDTRCSSVREGDGIVHRSRRPGVG